MTPDLNQTADDDRRDGQLNRLAGLPLFAAAAPIPAPAAAPIPAPAPAPAPAAVAAAGLLHAVPAAPSPQRQPGLGRPAAPATDQGSAGPQHRGPVHRGPERRGPVLRSAAVGGAGVGGPALAVLGPAAAPAGAPSTLPTPTAAQAPFDAVPGLPPETATLDWAQVRAFRQQAAELLTAQLRDRIGLDEPARREIGRALIVGMLRDHADSLLAQGLAAPSPAQERALAEAIFDCLFALGRLQPLVDDPDVENIEITGCDRVYLVYGDGRVQRAPAVADSDEELIETLAFLAARSGGSERAFTPAHPILDLTLFGGARLAARAWITPRPSVVIRRHRLTDVDLTDLIGLGMVDEVLAAFLSAAVRANKSMVVSGPQGAGKTTLLRALCNAMDPWERIGTIETEYELHLDRLPGRHHRVVAHQARPGTGERAANGRAAGEVTLDDLLYACLRMNLSRLVVGEVRGREVIPMIKAMQAGAGSLSTTHAVSARAAIERLVTCALEAGPHVTTEYAYRQIFTHIDLIVHLELDDQTRAGGGKHRYVTSVVEVGRGEGERTAVTDVFTPGRDGRAVPGTFPSFVADLERVGFDPGWLSQRDGAWQHSGQGR